MRRLSIIQTSAVAFLGQYYVGMFVFGWLGGLHAQSLTVTAPNGGENWTAGTTHSITWSVSGSTANVWYYKVGLSTDGGATYGTDLTPNGIVDPNARTFSWTISSSLSTTQARIRVRA